MACSGYVGVGIGFVVAVVVFSIAQAILSPFILKMASRYASAFLGGIGLLSTLVALVLASVLTDGMTILGVGSWIAATVLVWQLDLGRAREDTRGRPHYPARLDLRVGQHPPLRPFAAGAISPVRPAKGLSHTGPRQY